LFYKLELRLRGKAVKEILSPPRARRAKSSPVVIPHIVQVNVSDGGVPKRPVPEARIDEKGLAGDRQRHLRFHGGPDRAVCLMAIELIEAWAADGHPIGAGSAGENITVRGVDWKAVVPGIQLRLGATAIIEITDFALPCKQNKGWFSDGNFNRMNQKLFPGQSRVYARVLAPGTVQPGDTVAWVAGGQPAATRAG
jgi:MOSC domain-containing protein YiiM